MMEKDKTLDESLHCTKGYSPDINPKTMVLNLGN
jgi:hypothetical protein